MAMSELKQKVLKHELAVAGFPDAEYRGVPDRMFIDRKNDRMPDINDAGDIHYGAEYNHMAVHTIRPIVDRVNEMVAAWELSYQHNFKDSSQYRITAEYNNVVLAARDDTELGGGFNFVTWKYNQEHTGFDYGNFTTDYNAAKEDFAVRSGLIRQTKAFDKEQATEIRNAIMYRVENDGNLTISAEEHLRSIAARLTGDYSLADLNITSDTQISQVKGVEIDTFGEPQDDPNTALMLRVEKNYADYNISLLSMRKQELIDMAAKIHATSDAYSYMTAYHTFSDDELQFYLQFQNPLEVVADDWHERNIDTGDVCDVISHQTNTQDALVDYPLMSDTVNPAKEPAELPKETHAPAIGKSAFERGLERGKAKSEASKAQKASEPAADKKKTEERS